MTCNVEANKIKRQAFAQSLKKHQRDGDCIVYFDETNSNVYCKRGRGRAKKGKRATLVMPPSKGANLQVQCAVNSAMCVVLYRLEREREEDRSLLDNAPAHRQTEERVEPHDDLVLLRLASYSPMCNPIKGCFSGLKAHFKEHLALDREAICDRGNLTDSDGNRLTIKMELHARGSVNAAELVEDMVYGQ
ncbi:hypothetical protein PF002_g21208 [Phytophthora fragariae]|nr:hypothetical protein PF002_g21208 [Phytophthora fragariae]